MIRLAVATLRDRKAGFAGAFIALLLAAALASACGILLQTGLSATPRPERFAPYPVVVAGVDRLQIPDSEVVLPERAAVSDEVADRIRAVPGVTRVDRLGPAVGVIGNATPARIAEVLPEDTLKVYTGIDRGSAEFPERVQGQEFLLALSSSFGGIAQAIAVFVVAITMGLLVQQRHREIALLRAVGATARQVRSLIVLEIMLLAMVAGPVGVLAGIPLAGVLLGRLTDLSPVISPLPMIITVLIQLLVAGLAGWLTARRAGRIKPTAALQETGVERRGLGAGRIIAGVLTLALAGTIVVISQLAGGEMVAVGPIGGTLLLTIAAACFGPVLVRLATAVAGRVIGVLSPKAGYLAMATIRSGTRRYASAVVPLMLLVSMTGVTIFLDSIRADGAKAQQQAGMIADHVVTGPGLTADLPQVPTARAATAVVQTGVAARVMELGDPTLLEFTAQGVTPGAAETMDLGVLAGSLDGLTDETVALSRLTAASFHAGVGDTVPLYLGDGAQVRLRIVAIYERGYGFAAITLPYDLAVAHTTDRRPDQVLISGATRSEVEQAVAGIEGVQVSEPGAASADSAERAAEAEQSWTGLLFVAVILGYVAIAVVNTLMMTTADRGRELRLLRQVGATRRQVFRMLAVEAWFVAGLGLVVGTGFFLAGLVPASLVLFGSMPSIPLLGYAALAGFAVLLAMTAVLLPGRAVLNRS